MHQGGGVRYDFSTLHPAGSRPRGIGAIASGHSADKGADAPHWCVLGRETDCRPWFGQMRRAVGLLVSARC